MIVIHTDGACSENPGPGAWAFVLSGDGPTETFTGREPQTTSARMELTAAIEGLRRVPEGGVCRVVSDSKYVVNGAKDWMPRKWKRNGFTTAARNPVANQTLWRELDRLVSARTVEWRWVKGHFSDPMNEAAHRAARAALDGK